MVPPFKFGVVAFIVAAGCILHLYACGYQDDVLDRLPKDGVEIS
jgi:hypothetical protein